MASIGVITRTKNRPLLLARAIKSVTEQTRADWRMVIVNDGGDPGPVDALVAAVADPLRGRITIVHNRESHGMEAASNIGLHALDTRFVMIHDDDDSLHPEFFARTVGYLEAPPHPSVKGVITHTERIMEVIEGDTVRQTRTYPYNDWLTNVSIRRMLAENVFAPIAFVFDRAACHEVGAFREDLPVLGDWDFNVRFLQKYEIGVIREKLAYYHNREDSGEGAYSSSVNAKAHLHAFYDGMLRNEWLRNDIASGRTGVGVFANQTQLLWDLAWDIKQEIRTKRRFTLFGKR
jgi:glycosyltransferase involved in cell wall biosynthesis